MIRAQLHLVGNRGLPVSATIQQAVESAHRWTVRAFPNVDSALIADWAEEVALSMEAMAGEIQASGRYAAAALNGKVRDWLKTGPAKLKLEGAAAELERLGGIDRSTTSALDGKRLLEQIQATLNDRDQLILLLLSDHATDSEIAEALRLSDSAARKAIQRFRDRMAKQLGITRTTKAHPVRRSKTLRQTEEKSDVGSGTVQGLPAHRISESGEEGLSRRGCSKGPGEAGAPSGSSCDAAHCQVF